MSTPPNADNSLFEENIYLTSRVRMRSEIRMKRKNAFINLLITFYSFLLICVSIPGVEDIIYFNIPDSISLILSIALLVFSVFMQGERYAERAGAFRQSYLGLQILYLDVQKTPGEKIREYYSNLNACENHTDSDYRDTIVSAWLHNKKLKNSTDEIIINIPTVARYLADKILQCFVAVTLLSLPFIFVMIAK